MANLPTPGGDNGNWGTILNEYLEVEHNGDGTHLDASTTQKGVVELATDAEANSLDTSRAVTPASLYTTQALTDGATIDWNVANGAIATLTIAGNRTLNAPTNLINGATYMLVITQGTGGNHTLDFNDAAYKFPEGTEPTLSTAEGAVDIIAFVYVGSSLYGSFQGNFS